MPSRRSIKQSIQVMPGRPFEWQLGSGESANDRRAYAVMRELEGGGFQSNGSFSNSGMTDVNGNPISNWIDGDFGVGAPPPTDNRLYVEDETAGAANYAITAITQAASAVVTIGAHTVLVGEQVTFSGVGGMVEINGLTAAVTATAATTITVAINSSGFTAYTSGGTAAVAGSTQKFIFTVLTTAHSGLRGLRLEKSAGNGEPLGLTLQYDTGPVWDTVALDATTTDLVLAYSHADNVQADNLRLRQDTAQMNIGRVVGQPSLAGSQITVTGGEGGTVTNITKANPAVVTLSAAHHFAVGETVQFAGVLGMVEINFNNSPAPPAITVTARTSTTITLSLDTSGGGYTAYTGAGQAFVLMNGLRLSFWGNSNGFAFFQLLSASVSKRVKANFNNIMQMGTDADQNATGDFWISNNATGNFPFYVGASDRVFIGGGLVAPTPTARLHLGAGVAAASGAPFKLTTGVLNTAAEQGAMEFVTPTLYFSPTGTRKVIPLAPVTPSAFTPTNVTVDRSFDANATTLDEVADVLGQLIADLQATGIIG